MQLVTALAATEKRGGVFHNKRPPEVDSWERQGVWVNIKWGIAEETKETLNSSTRKRIVIHRCLSTNKASYNNKSNNTCYKRWTTIFGAWALLIAEWGYLGDRQRISKPRVANGQHSSDEDAHKAEKLKCMSRLRSWLSPSISIQWKYWLFYCSFDNSSTSPVYLFYIISLFFWFL